jgi:prolyl 4-hydroxylase
MITHHGCSIVQYDNWLSDQDIDKIFSKHYNWKNGQVRTNGKLISSNIRKCKTHRIEYGDDEYFDLLTKRVADFFNIENIQQIEPMPLIRYDVGDYFNWHTDLTSGFASQRTATMIMYLNDDFEGGCTVFAKNNLRIKPRRGSCVVYKYNTQEPMIHQGESVIAGSKYILTAFVRDREFTLTDRLSVSY